MTNELKKLQGQHLPKHANQAALKPFIDAVSELLLQKEVEYQRLQQTLTDRNQEFKKVETKLNTKLIENRASRNRLEEFIAKQQALLNATPEAVFSFKPNGTVTQMNRAAEAFIGIPFKLMETYDVKQNLALILDKTANPELFLQELRSLDEDRARTLRGYCTMRNGAVYEYHSIPEFMGNLYLGRVWCWRDVTELKASQEQLQHQAYHDSLTNLPNRLLLINRLKHAIDLAQRSGTLVATLFIDLDDFKKINDTEGHAIGDQFLISVSERIRSKLRDGDTFGRLGGDEFLILLEGLNHQHEVKAAYQRIKEVFEEPLNINHKQFFISGSIGVSQFPIDGNQPEELIRKADMAMYQAKNNGKNTVYYFEPSLEKYALHRMTLETQLRSAFDNHEFYLAYQPKVDIANPQVAGVEALLRWRRGNGAMVSPDSFIRIAEQIGLISNITELVLKEICLQIKRWRGTALEHTPVSMNISVNDLRTDGFLNLVHKTLTEHSVSASMIEFELTEYVFLEERDRVSRIIKELKSWGAQIAVDDFGTGYSCFSYLQDMDIDCLKIDKSFTRDLSHNPKSAAIVKTIVDIGKHLDMVIIAEGVESKEDLHYLKSIGCAYAQGFYYAPALSASELLNFTQQLNTTPLQRLKS